MTLDLIEAHALIFGFVLIRTLGILLAFPIWSGKMPMQWKIGAAMLLSVLFTFSGLSLDVPRDLPMSAFVLGIMQEFLAGSLLGFSARLFLGAVMLAGQLAGFQMGLGIANVIDPITSQRGSLLAQFLNLCVLFLFLEMDGHLMAVRTVAKSFEWIPLLSAQVNVFLFSDQVLEGGREMFQVGFQLA